MKQLSELEKETLNRLVGPTGHLVDRKSQIIALAWAREQDVLDEVIRIILDKRAGYIDWLSVVQRRWQKETRNRNKCRHNDSWFLREKYVTCR